MAETQTPVPLADLVPDPTKPCCDWSHAFGALLREKLADPLYAEHTDALHAAQRLYETGCGHALRAFKTFPGRRQNEHQAKALEAWSAAITRLQTVVEGVTSKARDEWEANATARLQTAEDAAGD